MDNSHPCGFGDQPPDPGTLLIRVFVPELNVKKCLQYPSDILVWDVKQQILASLPKVSFLKGMGNGVTLELLGFAALENDQYCRLLTIISFG